MALTIVCDGEITQTVDGAATCSTGWLTQASVLPFDLSQIDPAVATAMFTAGFGLIITPWAAAWGLSKLCKFILRS